MATLLDDPTRVQPAPGDPIRYDADPEPFDPSALDVAFDLGYRLERCGEDAHPPLGWSLEEMAEFYAGTFRSRMDRATASDRRRNALITRASAHPAPSRPVPHYNDLVEAGGVDFARAYRDDRDQD